MLDTTPHSLLLSMEQTVKDKAVTLESHARVTFFAVRSSAIKPEVEISSRQPFCISMSGL